MLDTPFGLNRVDDFVDCEVIHLQWLPNSFLVFKSIAFPKPHVFSSPSNFRWGYILGIIVAIGHFLYTVVIHAWDLHFLRWFNRLFLCTSDPASRYVRRQLLFKHLTLDKRVFKLVMLVGHF